MSHVCEVDGVVAECEVEDFGKSAIATGICFLDHMVDQFTSHGQVGVRLRMRLPGAAEPCAPHVDYAANSATARPHDGAIAAAAGGALGAALRALATSYGAAAASRPRTFCCPLDEAYAECVLDLAGAGCAIALAPFGTATPGGRKWLGRLQTRHAPAFWEALATALGCGVALSRRRGANGHHVLESAFKAFARCYRKCLDAAAPPPPPPPVGIPRRGKRDRATKETRIAVALCLDGGGGATVETGVAAYDAVLRRLLGDGGVSGTVTVDGDTFIDDHHSVEDASIAVGQALLDALGDRAGVARMASGEATVGDHTVRAVVDLSNRPSLVADLAFAEEYVGEVQDASAATLTAEMAHHAFESLTVELRATVHLEVRSRAPAGNGLDLALAAAAAYGAAFREAAAFDPRRKGAVASSKGTLSV